MRTLPSYYVSWESRSGSLYANPTAQGLRISYNLHLERTTHNEDDAKDEERTSRQ